MERDMAETGAPNQINVLEQERPVHFGWAAFSDFSLFHIRCSPVVKGKEHISR